MKEGSTNKLYYLWELEKPTGDFLPEFKLGEEEENRMNKEDLLSQKKRDLIKMRDVVKRMILDADTKAEDKEEASILLLRINKALDQIKGNIKDRVQLLNPKTNRWVKVNTETGAIISHKKSPNPYKNIKLSK